MKHKALRAGIIAAVLCCIISATAFAAYHADYLGTLFRGDLDILPTETAPQTIVFDDYTFTVHQVVADEINAYIIFSLSPRTEAAAAALAASPFDFVENIEVSALPDSSITWNGYGTSRLAVEDDTAQYFYTMEFGSYQNPDKDPVQLSVYDQALIVPMDSGLDTLKRSIGAETTDIYGNAFTVSSLTITPISVNINLDVTAFGQAAEAPLFSNLYPAVFFRMADGSIVTLRQLGGVGNGGSADAQGVFNMNTSELSETAYACQRNFYELLDVSSVVSVIVDGLEYSLRDLDAAPPAVQVPEALQQFTIDLYIPDRARFDAVAEKKYVIEQENGTSIITYGWNDIDTDKVPVAAICSKLGAYWSWDADSGTLVIDYLGKRIEHTMGSDERITLDYDGGSLEIDLESICGLAVIDGTLYCNLNLFYSFYNVQFQLYKLHPDATAPSDKYGYIVTP
ncbi:MAG: DUF4179 domain-containing protein [Oscillospiraceae bacterium]|nr:DUF4179 domain-containing protein [Oscillospiraceae bacterium]